MPMIPTLVALVVAIALAVFSGWRGAQPPDPRRGPRMMPWRFLMLLCGAVVFVLAIHLGALLGFAPRQVIP